MATPWFRLFPPAEQEDLVFLGDPGPRPLNCDEEDPIDFFTLLFPQILLREVVRQTNK